MSEYWKSTPKYWCKHCQVYVRDTKLERANHEATGKHQGALKRFLRDLHRNHEKDERDKERVKQEIERLNGVVGAPSSLLPATAAGASSTQPSARPTIPAAPTQVQRQKQWEQLAEMGIDVPTQLRGDMAMAGEWTVTNTRIVDDTPQPELAVEAVATGVRKRPKQEGEEEEEEAMHGLFKKPKHWGRDTRAAPEDETDLDALLNESVLTKKEDKTAAGVKQETEHNDTMIPTSIDRTKPEPHEGDADTPDAETNYAPLIKKEDSETAGVGVPAVVFKKRKPKNIRQK